MNLVLAAVLTVPKMSVKVVGDALQVSFEKLPLTSVVRVTVWKRGDALQVRVLPPFYIFYICISSFLHVSSLLLSSEFIPFLSPFFVILFFVFPLMFLFVRYPPLFLNLSTFLVIYFSSFQHVEMLLNVSSPLRSSA